MKFYLGTHRPSWLDIVDVELFVSHRALIHPLPDGRRRPLPRARAGWVLDSGAFTEIVRHGAFTTSPADYCRAVALYRDEIGRLEWATPQDHMTEPFALERSTIARTVRAAQRWTVDNYLELRTLDATLPFVPVLQGQTLEDYRYHRDLYARAGIDLELEPVVGLGSVCRRQASTELVSLIGALARDGLRLHGFGVKTAGVHRLGELLASADSLAWSYRGRHVRPCPHKPERQSCSSCLPHALEWRRRIVDAATQLELELVL